MWSAIGFMLSLPPFDGHLAVLWVKMQTLTRELHNRQIAILLCVELTLATIWPYSARELLSHTHLKPSILEEMVFRELDDPTTSAMVNWVSNGTL